MFDSPSQAATHTRFSPESAAPYMPQASRTPSRRALKTREELDIRKAGYQANLTMAAMTPDTLFMVLVMFSSYSLAGCLMEHFAVFYAWTLTSTPLDLRTIQYHSGMRVFYVYVIPKSLTTVLTAYFAFTWGHVDLTLLLRPWLWMQLGAQLMESWAWWCLACLSVSWISSVRVQIPLQLEVRANADRRALRRLLRTNWIRVLAMVAHVSIVTCVALTTFQ